MRFLKLYKKVRFLKWDVLEKFNFNKYKGEKWTLFYIHTVLAKQKLISRLFSKNWPLKYTDYSFLYLRDKNTKKSIKKFFLLSKQRLRMLAPYIKNIQLKSMAKKSLKKSTKILKPAFLIFAKLILLRLDIILYLSFLVEKPKLSSLFFRKFCVKVNNKVVKVPSYQVFVGDVITIRSKITMFSRQKFVIEALMRNNLVSIYEKLFINFKTRPEKRKKELLNQFQVLPRSSKNVKRISQLKQNILMKFRSNKVKKIFPNYLSVGPYYIKVRPLSSEDLKFLYKTGIDPSAILEGTQARISFG